jgi:Raf kinase inhibitor-like YbhB/YbcL family protein
MDGRRDFLRQISRFAGAIALVLTGCASGRHSNDDAIQAPETMTLTSSAFSPGGMIPTQHTCNGNNGSPPLSWDAPPQGTRSLVLIVDDPDAPGRTFVHWVLYDVPSDIRQLPEGVPTQPILLQGGVQGKNDFGKYGYGGPCPPGGTHQYRFKLYALDTLLDLPPGVREADVIEAMKGHVLAKAELIGRYSRQQ